MKCRCSKGWVRVFLEYSSDPSLSLFFLVTFAKHLGKGRKDYKKDIVRQTLCQLKVTEKRWTTSFFVKKIPLPVLRRNWRVTTKRRRWNALKKNWKQIRSHIIRRKLVDIYHIRITEKFDIRQILHAIFREQKTTFKINLAFGFVLRNINTGDIRYYYPSQNGYIFDKPVVITNEEELEALIESMASRDWKEEIRQQKPGSLWRIVTVCCVGIYIFKVLHVPVGRGGGEDGILPPYLKENRGLDALERSLQTGKHYEDNLCYFRCLARNKGFHVKTLEKKKLSHCWSSISRRFPRTKDKRLRVSR